MHKAHFRAVEQGPLASGIHQVLQDSWCVTLCLSQSINRESCTEGPAELCGQGRGDDNEVSSWLLF